MAIDARLRLSLRRNEARAFLVRVIGMSAADLAAAAPRMQIRDSEDAGGAALLSLTVVGDGSQGLRIEPLDPVGSVARAMLHIQIAKATATDSTIFQYGALGEVVSFAYGLQWGGRTRLHGALDVVGSAVDSDGAPTNRPVAGSDGGGSIEAGASVTIAGDEVVELVLDGAGELSAMVAAAAAIGADVVRHRDDAASAADRSLAAAQGAAQEADRAEAGALAALLSLGDGVYENDVAAGLAATAPDGSEAFYNVAADGQLDLIANQGGTAKIIFSLPTRASLRSNGINLWEVARRGASTDAGDMAETTAAINSVIEDASSWGVGKINCGGRDRVYHCGGAFPTFGTWMQAQPDGTIQQEAYRRGLIRLRSNVELVGASPVSRAIFRLAPGYTNPGSLFSDRFWEQAIANVGFRWVELDGNTANQTVTTYRANTADVNQWFHGMGIEAGSIRNLRVHECAIHDFQGHGVYHFSALDFDRHAEQFTSIRSDYYNNLMGAGQLAVNRIHTERNYCHGDGGVTALGFNVEVHGEAETMLDIVSLYDEIDGRDGWSATLATTRDYNGFPGLDTGSTAARAARTRIRRGYWLSGNYYSPPVDKLFKRQRGRIAIVGMKTWDGTIGGAGIDRLHIIDPQIEISANENILRQFPGALGPIAVNAGTDYTVAGYDEIVIRDAMIVNALDVPAIILGNFQRIDVSAQVKGGAAPALRTEFCGGRARISARNVGRVEADSNPATAGQHGAAVTVFGLKGPLDIDVQAIDTRTGADRRLQHAVYANVGRDFVVTATGSVQRQSGVAIKDPNGNVIDRGLIDAADRVQRLTGPVAMTGGIVVDGDVLVQSGTDNVSINLRAPAGKTSAINFATPDGLEGQLILLSNGSMQVQIHEKGEFIAAPIAALNDGTLLVEMGWQRPVRDRATGAYLWFTAAGVLRSSTEKPTSEDSGTAVGAQA